MPPARTRHLTGNPQHDQSYYDPSPGLAHAHGPGGVTKTAT